MYKIDIFYVFFIVYPFEKRQRNVLFLGDIRASTVTSI